jgi:hypothetical protein
MKKTIIAVYGRKDEGKSSSIKLVCHKLLDEFPNAISSIPKEEISYSGDILLVITLGSVRIGIESQGDPNSRMITEETIKYLAEEKCDIILCATRTGGETVHKVDEIADAYNYHTLWLSTFWGPHLSHQVLNDQLSDQIIRLITSLIVGQL